MIKLPSALLVNTTMLGNYRIAGRMGEGTFSEVLKCQSLVDGKMYACKRMKQKYDNIDEVNNLREIQALRRLNPHPNIIELKDVVYDRRSGTLALICELMDMNIYELIKDRKTYLPEAKVKLYMYQLCKSIYHMHRNGIFHRDVKPENILITVETDNVKLADFGSCKSINSKHPYTEYISTRWYRAPECLLTDGIYGYKMDMWSVGCVMYEVLSLRPLFPGSNELDQVSRIHDVLGTPSPAVLNKFRKYQSRSMDFHFPYKKGTGIASQLKRSSQLCVDLIARLCAYDPEERLSAKDALRHPYFKDLRDSERRAKLASRTPSITAEVSTTKLFPNIRPHPVRQLEHLGSIGEHMAAVPQVSQAGMAMPSALTLPQIVPAMGYSGVVGPSVRTHGTILPAVVTGAANTVFPSAPKHKPAPVYTYLPSLAKYTQNRTDAG
ncbi:hypothetical protein EMCRGX_G032131 [Ephydatia muelleri]